MQNPIITAGNNPLGSIISEVINTNGVQVLFAPLIALREYYRKITQENRLESRYFIGGTLLLLGVIVGAILPSISVEYNNFISSWFGFVYGNASLIVFMSIWIIGYPLSAFLQSFFDIRSLILYGNMKYYLTKSRKKAISTELKIKNEDVQIMFDFLVSCERNKIPQFSLNIPPTSELLDKFMRAPVDDVIDIYRTLRPYYYAYHFKKNPESEILQNTLFNPKKLADMASWAVHEGKMPNVTPDTIKKVFILCLNRISDKKEVEQYADAMSHLLDGGITLGLTNIKILQEANALAKAEAYKLAKANEEAGKDLTNAQMNLQNSPDSVTLHPNVQLHDVEMGIGSNLGELLNPDDEKSTSIHKVPSYHTLDQKIKQPAPLHADIDTIVKQTKTLRAITNKKDYIHRHTNTLETPIIPLTEVNINEYLEDWIKYTKGQEELIKKAQEKIPETLDTATLQVLTKTESEESSNHEQAQTQPNLDAQSARSSGLHAILALGHIIKDNQSVSSGNSAANSAKSAYRRLSTPLDSNNSPMHAPPRIGVIDDKQHNDPLTWSKPKAKKVFAENTATSLVNPSSINIPIKDVKNDNSGVVTEVTSEGEEEKTDKISSISKV